MNLSTRPDIDGARFTGIKKRKDLVYMGDSDVPLFATPEKSLII